MDKIRPTVVAINGLSANVGTTTLMGEPLPRLPGREAIKVTRGYYHYSGRLWNAVV